jgi:hypothetical protein
VLARSKSTGGSRGGFVFREGKMDFFVLGGDRIVVAFISHHAQAHKVSISHRAQHTSY